MLKKLLLSALALALVLPVMAQHQRRVLIEEFTNASCGPCAAQNPAFNATIAANEEYLTPIKYQTNWPGFDPMNQQTQAEVQPRVTYYGVTGVPNGRQNGILEVFPMTTYSSAMIQTAYNTLTPVTISLTHSISATYDTVYATVSVTSDAALTGTLRLRVAVVENEIFFEAAPGSNGEKDFFQVMRKMLPNSGGTTTGDFAAGETKTYNFAWPLAYIYDLNQIGVSAWLQDDATKEVWQSARSLPLGGIPSAGVKIPSANTFACAPGFKPTFTLTNTNNTALTTADLRWRIGGGAWKDYAWTGDLAGGASTQVTLDTVITQAGTITIDVEVLGSNNGIQTNMVDAVSKIQTKTLFDTPTALPFVHGFQSGTVPPPGWTVNNYTSSTGTQGWKIATNAGFNSTRSTRCNFYDFANAKVYLTTPKLDLSTANGVTTLSFDHAYAYYSASLFDSLRVELSNDCGETWTTVFHDGKDGLATAPATTAAFTPTATQWASNSIDISAFNGSAELLMRFIGESGYGNNLFVDNINVTALVGVKELELNTFSIRPNPTSSVAQVIFGLEKAESIQLSVYNAQGALVQSRNLGDLPSGEHIVNLEATSLTSGTYRIVLQGKEGVATAQWMIVK